MSDSSQTAVADDQSMAVRHPTNPVLLPLCPEALKVARADLEFHYSLAHRLIVEALSLVYSSPTLPRDVQPKAAPHPRLAESLERLQWQRATLAANIEGLRRQREVWNSETAELNRTAEFKVQGFDRLYPGAFSNDRLLALLRQDVSERERFSDELLATLSEATTLDERLENFVEGVNALAGKPEPTSPPLFRPNHQRRRHHHHHQRRRHHQNSVPPAAACFLLDLLLAKPDRNAIQGDLEEEFSAKVAKRGPTGARRWFWGQTVWTIAVSNPICHSVLVGGLMRLLEWILRQIGN
jgi:hypothetical protein